MKLRILYSAAVALLLASSPADAVFFLDFESGVDGAEVDDIAGVTFESYNGYTSIYGDSQTGSYNTTSDDEGMSWNGGNYHHYGFKWLWAGSNADAQGVIVDFTNNDGTYFQTGYSAASTFYIDLHHTDATMKSVSGGANIGGPMTFLNIAADAGKTIDYLVLHDTGNAWLVDNMSGDTSGVSSVPEPTTISALGLGLLGWIVARRRRKSQS